jgi:hypothetical protein
VEVGILVLVNEDAAAASAATQKVLKRKRGFINRAFCGNYSLGFLDRQKESRGLSKDAETQK